MKHSFIIKMIVVTVTVIVAVTLVYFAFLDVMPGLIPVLESGDAAAVEAYLEENDSAVGVICTVLIQIITIVSVVLSSVPVQIAAGIVYGTLQGFCICHLASVMTHTAVFYAARKLGAKLNKIVDGEDTEHEASKFNFLAKSDMPAYATALTYLIPIIPNGIIPYVAAKTDITLPQFAAAVYTGTFLPILILCAAGNKFVTGDILASVLLMLVLFVLVAFLWKMRDRIMHLIRNLAARRKHRRK